MEKCAECGKKLGRLEGHYHPTFGKRWIFCSTCFDKIEEKTPINKIMEKRFKKKGN